MSPLPVDKLTHESGMQTIREAISESIQQCMKEPTPEGYDVPNKQEWCAAKCYSIAREKTGNPLKEGSQQ